MSRETRVKWRSASRPQPEARTADHTPTPKLNAVPKQRDKEEAIAEQ